MSADFHNGGHRPPLQTKGSKAKARSRDRAFKVAQL
jgi:hypothetical protein